MTTAELKAMTLKALRKLATQHGVPVRSQIHWLPRAWLVDVLARKLCPSRRDGAWALGDVPAH